MTTKKRHAVIGAGWKLKKENGKRKSLVRISNRQMGNDYSGQ